MRLVIVYDEDFSSHLENVAFHTPVWLIDTPANRAAAEDVWHKAVDWPHITVTLFRRQEWDTLIKQIAFQEKRPVESMEIVGAPLTESAQNAFENAGFVKVEATERGFRAKR